MKRFLFFIFSGIFIFTSTFATLKVQAWQNQPRKPNLNFSKISEGKLGLVKNESQTYPGYTLFAPKHNTMTYLIDNNGYLVHQWIKSTYEPGQTVYLLEGEVELVDAERKVVETIRAGSDAARHPLAHVLNWDLATRIGLQEKELTRDYIVYEHAIAVADTTVAWIYGVAAVGLFFDAQWSYKLALIPGSILVYHSISAWVWEGNRRAAGRRLWSDTTAAPVPTHSSQVRREIVFCAISPGLRLDMVSGRPSMVIKIHFILLVRIEKGQGQSRRRARSP